MTSWLYLALAAIALGLTGNAFFPLRSGRFAFASFGAGWLTIELAWQHLVGLALASSAFVALGALERPLGILAAALSGLSALGLLVCARQSARTRETVHAALETGLGPAREGGPSELRERLSGPVGRARLFRPFHFEHPEVRLVADVPYADVAGPRNTLDLYVPARPLPGAPVVLQVHGGAWVIGNKRQQARPLLVDLASRGLFCVSANYRLSPRATFPEHLLDLKRALIWIREHLAEHGGDPTTVIVTGGSAGGHLATLLALTPNDPRYQPGQESVDTRVQGCIPFYGVYDLVGLAPEPLPAGLLDLWQRSVLKRRLSEDREAFLQASPLHHVRADAPPFFIIHGTHDSLAPTATARHFAERLGSVSRAPVVYAELSGAQHAFDIFHSVRTHHVIEGVHRFIAFLAEREMREGTRPPAPYSSGVACGAPPNTA